MVTMSCAKTTPIAQQTSWLTSTTSVVTHLKSYRITTRWGIMPRSSAVLLGENRLFRDGIRQMLEKSSISVVAEGRDILDTVGADDRVPSAELIIFHVASEGISASPSELITDLRERFPAAKLVLLADPSAKPLLPAFIQANVSAILLTDISGETLE